MADYQWETASFTGEPLKTMLSSAVSDMATVVDALADILRFQADLLDTLGEIVNVLVDPMAAIAAAFMSLLDSFIDVFVGQVHLLFVQPLSWTDRFGPAGFSARVSTAFDDQWDSMRPMFESDTDRVAMLVYYFNAPDLTSLLLQCFALSLFFPTQIAMLSALAAQAELYEPREQRIEIAMPERTYGQPPDWISPTGEGVSYLMAQLASVFRSIQAKLKPAPAIGDYLFLFADALRALATSLEGLADVLNDLAAMIEAFSFNAARLWVPMTYGGNQILKDILETLETNLNQEFIEQAEGEPYPPSEAAETGYSFGLVAVGGLESFLMMQILGGIGVGLPVTMDANTVEIRNGEVVVV